MEADLFGAARQPPRHHRHDPETSVDAASASVHFASQQALVVLAALKRFGPMAAHEFARHCHLTQAQVCRRRSELLDAGLVRITGERRPTPSGKSADVLEACA